MDTFLGTVEVDTVLSASFTQATTSLSEEFTWTLVIAPLTASCSQSNLILLADPLITCSWIYVGLIDHLRLCVD